MVAAGCPDHVRGRLPAHGRGAPGNGGLAEDRHAPTMVGPVLDELGQEYEGKLNVYKVNTDEEQELGAMFGIRSIPSILFVPVEGQPKMAVGALPKNNLKEIIEKELLTAAA